MSAKSELHRQIEAALTAARDGRPREGRAILDRLSTHPEAALLGPATMLGLPRQLHSAQLRLAKLGGNLAEITGLRATAMPPAELLADLFAVDMAARKAMAQAADWPVPRIVHQVWIGGPEPRPCALWRDWAMRHGWAYRLWDESALAALDLERDPVWQAMQAAGDLPGVVDLARYHILQREGGLYLDCDWYPIRPDLPPDAILPRRGLAAIAEAGPRLLGSGAVLFANGLIATPPGHPVFARLLADLPRLLARLPHAPAWWLTGPLPFTLAMHGGPVTMLDPALVAGRVPRGAPIEMAQEMARQMQSGTGFLIEWKDW